MSKTVATFVQNVGLIWLKGGFLLLSVILDTNVIIGLKLLFIRTNGVMCPGKEIKSGLKLIRIEETDVATRTCKLNIGLSIFFFCKGHRWQVNFCGPRTDRLLFNLVQRSLATLYFNYYYLFGIAIV